MSEEIIKPRGDHNPCALIQAQNVAMMEHIIKLQPVIDAQLMELKQQAKELEALRGFAEIMKTTKFERMLDGRAADGFIKKTMALCKLIDENGQPTSLLTG